MPYEPVDLGHPDANRAVNSLLAHLDDSPPSWWYLSFVDTDLAATIPLEQQRPGGPSWLGACYVDAPNFYMACVRAHELGCNPGGQVKGWPIPDDVMDEKVPESMRRRLLTREDVRPA